MSQFPQPPTSPPSYPGLPGWQFAPPLRTSGLAVASMILGSVGLLTCCALAPSTLAIVFAGVALPAIKRGEVKGRGIAIAGLVLGILGVLIGAAFWIAVALSPSNHALPGNLVKPHDKATLERLGAIEKGEEIVMFYSGGNFSVRESGAVITATRLITYTKGSPPRKAALADIHSVKFAPVSSWLEDSEFTVTLDDGQTFTFQVATMQGADRQFNTALKLAVTEARQANGKTAKFSEMDAEAPAKEEDEKKTDEPPPPTTHPKVRQPK